MKEFMTHAAYTVLAIAVAVTLTAGAMWTANAITEEDRRIAEYDAFLATQGLERVWPKATKNLCARTNDYRPRLQKTTFPCPEMPSTARRIK